MPSSRAASLAGLVLVAFASLTACAVDAGKDVGDVGSVENELRLSGTRYLGKIQNGQTRTGYYSNPPRYRSFAFDAQGGDTIAIDVASTHGDAMAWITTSSYNVLAFNDDASPSTLDAKVIYTVPASQPQRSYRIVFRDYDHWDAHFSVTLNIEAAPEPLSCTYAGTTYQGGDSFKSVDGCNDCFCAPDGVGCTKRACACNPANEPLRSYVGTPQQCMVIRYTCTAGRRAFQNDCGCGCEDIP
jgi:hypothetical protein